MASSVKAVIFGLTTSADQRHAEDQRMEQRQNDKVFKRLHETICLLQARQKQQEAATKE